MSGITFCILALFALQFALLGHVWINSNHSKQLCEQTKYMKQNFPPKVFARLLVFGGERLYICTAALSRDTEDPGVYYVISEDFYFDCTEVDREEHPAAAKAAYRPAQDGKYESVVLPNAAYNKSM